MILDGGLATELERMGHNLDHPLWSARIVSEKPEAIKQVHLSYLKAGADMITTASYQASFPGCMKEGLSEKAVAALLRKTVEIASLARDEFLESKTGDKSDPLIAASIGPYGAYLANGAEYTGEYNISKEELYDFHIKRWKILAETEVDLMVCETIPSFKEAEVLSGIVEETSNRKAWMSFTSKDGENISDGTPIKKCAQMIASNNQVVAVGINCTPPQYISSLIEKVREGAPNKAIIAYPNSGEVYDAASSSWRGNANKEAFADLAKEWVSKGATIVGGCCRVGPDHIRLIVKDL